MDVSPETQYKPQHDLTTMNPFIVLRCAAPGKYDHIIPYGCIVIDFGYHWNGVVKTSNWGRASGVWFISHQLSNKEPLIYSPPGCSLHLHPGFIMTLKG